MCDQLLYLQLVLYGRQLAFTSECEVQVELGLRFQLYSLLQEGNRLFHLHWIVLSISYFMKDVAFTVGIAARKLQVWRFLEWPYQLQSIFCQAQSTRQVDTAFRVDDRLTPQRQRLHLSRGDMSNGISLHDIFRLPMHLFKQRLQPGKLLESGRIFYIAQVRIREIEGGGAGGRNQSSEPGASS
jgi:hypothetical protein